MVAQQFAPAGVAECCGDVWQLESHLHPWESQDLAEPNPEPAHSDGATRTPPWLNNAQQTSRFQLSPQYFKKEHSTCTKGLVKELCALLGVREPMAQNKILITQTPSQEQRPF